jgi:sulfur-oxidizing protein SoxY
MSLSRRTILKSLSGILSLALPSALMAKWPQAAFEAKDVDTVLDNLYDYSEMEESSEIKIKAPPVVENGRIVQIEIETNLANVKSIAIISETNPVPLVGEFYFADNVLPWVKTRIKMGATGNLIAIVKTNTELYIARKQITVNMSGCA